MATSFGAAATLAASNAQKSSTYLLLCHRHFFLRSNSYRVSFRLSPRQNLRFSPKGLQSGWNYSSMAKAQLSEVAVDGSSKAANSTPTDTKDVNSSNEPPPQAVLASGESISEFITQVASLVKLVDSKDIVELQLKQLDCEILIRKKEASPPPASPPVTYVQSQPEPAVLPPVSTSSPVPDEASSPPPTRVPSPPKAQPSKSSHPPLKCPMAGTFYRSPGPGEPPFVKVGDKVQKGQVLCIVEAMKLMNEIEADQSGTIVEVLVEDGKPVSVDTPLFAIEP